MTSRCFFIHGHDGLGDCIYQRGIVRQLCQRHPQVYLRTPWPELYRDLRDEFGLRFVGSTTSLRAQRQNVDRQPPATWTTPSARCETIRLRYPVKELQRGKHILRAMADSAGLEHVPVSQLMPTADLASLGLTLPRLRTTMPPIAVIRPCTLRREWLNDARNCEPDHIRTITQRLRGTHATWLIVQLEEREEWMAGGRAWTAPDDVGSIYDTLTVHGLLVACKSASLLVGPPGWLIPMSMMFGTPAFIIMGGYMPFSAMVPQEADWIGHVAPTPFCGCYTKQHSCNKEIDFRTLTVAFGDFMAKEEARHGRRAAASAA